MLIRRLCPNDAKAFKALRLEGLSLNPEAFGASYAEEADQPLERFADRLAADAVFGGYDNTGALRGTPKEDGPAGHAGPFRFRKEGGSQRAALKVKSCSPSRV
jgi:hypothetical protein